MKKILATLTAMSIALYADTPLYEIDFDNGLDGKWRTLRALGDYTPDVVTITGNNKRLRLTDRKHDLSMAVTLDYEFPTQNNQFVLEFDYFAYGGCEDGDNFVVNETKAGKWGADGMSIILFDSSVGTRPRVGASGGSLGYANGNIILSTGALESQRGFERAWLGIGLDEFGAFSNNSENRKDINGNTTSVNDYIEGDENPNSVAIRGDAQNGYRLLKSVSLPRNKPIAREIINDDGIISLFATRSYKSGRYRLTVDSRDDTHLYITLERKTDTSGYQTVIETFDAMSARYHQGAKPQKFRIAFSSGSAGACNIHEIDNVVIFSQGEEYYPYAEQRRCPDVDQKNFIWYVDNRNGIHKVNIATQRDEVKYNHTSRMGDIAISPDGRVFVVDLETNGNIYEIDNSNTYYLGGLGVNKFPNALSFDEHGYLYVGYHEGKYYQVKNINRMDQKVVWFDPKDFFPAWHTVGSSGDVLFLDGKAYASIFNTTLQKDYLVEITLGPDNSVLSKRILGKLPPRSFGLASDGFGAIYVGSDNYVYKLMLPSPQEASREYTIEKERVATVSKIIYGLSGVNESLGNACIKPLIAEYRFDACNWYESATVVDNSPNSLDGEVIRDAFTIDQGIVGRAGSFDNSGYVKVANDEKLNPDTITVMAWINPIELEDWDAVIVKSTNGNWQDGWGIVHTTGTNDIHFFMGAWNHKSVKADIDLQTYTHVAGTYDGHEIKLYINGQLRATKSLGLQEITKSYAPLRIGSGAGSYNWYGYIDEVKIFKGALSEEKIRTIYKNELAGKNADATERESIECTIPMTCSDNELYFSNASEIGSGKASDKMWLHTINKTTSPFTFTTVGEPYPKTYNALAYNPVDNYLYATYKNSMLRIGKNGNVVTVGILHWLDHAQNYAATFDKNGYYYLADWSHSNQIYKIDLDTLEKIQTISLKIGDQAYWPEYYDMTLDASGDYFYAVDVDTKNHTNQLFKIRISDGQVTKIGQPVSASAVDTLFSDRSGAIYVLLREGGFYQVDAQTGEWTPVSSSAPLTYLNDGANCPNAILTFEPTIAVGDAIVTEGGRLSFPVTVTGNIEPGTLRFKYRIYDGNFSDGYNAIHGKDFDASHISGTVHQDEAHNMQIEIMTIDDHDIEKDEKLYIKLSDIEGALFIEENDLVGIGTIKDNDYNKLDAYDSVGADFSNKIIKTKIVNKPFSLKVVNVMPNGRRVESAQQLTDINNTQYKIVDAAVCTTDVSELNLTGFSSLPPFDESGTAIVSNIIVPRSIKNARVQLYWVDENGPNASCSSDNFSVRPKGFKITVPHTLVAGQDFNLTLEAVDYLGHRVLNYEENLSLGTPGGTYASVALDYNNTKTGAGCINGQLDIKTSHPVFHAGKALLTVNYSDIGKVKLRVYEKSRTTENVYEYAYVDRDDSTDDARYIQEDIKITNNFTPAKVVLEWQFSNGDRVNGLTYYNSRLNLVTSQQVMAALFDINATVMNYEGEPLKNFTNSCDWATDIRLNIRSVLESDVGMPLEVVAQYQDLENSIITPDNQISTIASILGNTTDIFNGYKLDKYFFEEGKGRKAVYFNFKRQTNQPYNPMKLTIQGVDILEAYPATSNGTNEQITFVYARAYIPDQTFIGDEGEAKVFFEVYCQDCNRTRYGLETLPESVDHINWYQLSRISEFTTEFVESPEITNQDIMHYGNVPISARDNGPGKVSALVQNVPERTLHIEVTKSPMSARIDYKPKSYLIYNPFSTTADKHSFVAKFLPKEKSWAGKGETGYTVDTTIAPRNKTDVIDW